MGATGFDPKVSLDDPEALTKIRRELKDAGAERIWYIADAFRAGLSVDGVFNLTNIDRWFLVQIEELVRLEEKVAEVGITGLNAEFLRQLKRKGFADARLAKLAGVREAEIRKLRDQYDLHPVYKRVDTCAAEFATDTAYMYSTYEEECEANPSTDREKIMVLGGGPNRIGQVSNSTTAAYTPRWRCAKTVTKPLWLTVTRKPSPLITTLPIASTSSR